MKKWMLSLSVSTAVLLSAGALALLFGEAPESRADGNAPQEVNAPAAGLRGVKIATASIDVRFEEAKDDQVRARLVPVEQDGKYEEKLTQAREGDVLAIRVEQLDDMGLFSRVNGWFKPEQKRELIVALPESVRHELTVETASGDIDLPSWTFGQLTAKTASGDVETGCVKAKDISVATSSGDVHAECFEAAEVTARTASGDVGIDKLSGASRLESVSGDVTATSDGGAVSARSTSGSIDLQLSRIDAPIDARSVSGDISVKAPNFEDVGLATRTTIGKIRYDQKLFGKDDVKFRISLSTTSGDIAVQKL